MKTKTIEVCNALHVDVSCERNDDFNDIKCGGAPILGYDFFVSPDENRDELYAFIRKCLRAYKRPLIGINMCVCRDFPVDKLWTREMIEKCIKEHAVA